MIKGEKELKEYSKEIFSSELRKFVDRMLEVKEKEGPSEKALLVYEILLKLVKEKGFYNEQAPQLFVDVLLSGALLHDLEGDPEEDWTVVFIPRKTWQEEAAKLGLSENVMNGIFDAIEGQLGEKNPIDLLKTKAGTPNELFSTAVWIANYHIEKVKEL